MPADAIVLPSIELPATTEHFVTLIFWGLLIAVAAYALIVKGLLPIISAFAEGARLSAQIRRLTYEANKATQQSRIAAENAWGAKMVSVANEADEATIEELVQLRVTKQEMAAILDAWARLLDIAPNGDYRVKLSSFINMWREGQVAE